MKKLTLTLTLLFSICLVGCSSVVYENPETGARFVYHRVGKQNISGLEVRKTETGDLRVKMGDAKGEVGDLAAVLANMSEVAARLAH